jgi:hypothetical protein
MPIPAFRADGYQPVGLHAASEEELMARFGQSTARREYLSGRLRRWLALARAVAARRFFVFSRTRESDRRKGVVEVIL